MNSLFLRRAARGSCLLLLSFVCRSGFGLETTGALDAPFDAGTFTNGQVTATIIQPDGKFLVSGSFTKANGVARRNIARFHPDGTLDAMFDPGAGLDFAPGGMILQPDNKILIFNGFSTVNGVPRFASLARLESNGALDASFNPGNVISYDGEDDGMGNATTNGFVTAVVLLPGGKILVFGQFYYVITGPGTNVARSCVARFNGDGTFDASFNPGTGFTSLLGPETAFVSVVARQNLAPNDGKIIVAGTFDGYNGTAVTRMLRLDADGVYDATFTPGTAAPPETLAGLFVQNDDQVIAFGTFATFDSAPRSAIARLSSSGVLDAGFSTTEFKDYGDPGTIAGVAQQADGRLIVGGYFHTLGGVTANNVARLESNGARDPSFSGNAAGPMGFNVLAVAVRPSDQKVLLGGWFPTYEGVNQNNLVLVDTNGALDPVFAPSSGVTDAGPEIYAVVTQPDGKVILGGVFTSFNGVPLHNIVRLKSDGSRDTKFGIVSGTSRSVRAMAVQSNGQIIIAGTFTAIDGVAQGRIARLDADGTVDPTFNPGTGPDNVCYAVAVDAADNVYIGGAFQNVNGVPRAGVAKLTPTGALDMTFDPGTGFNSTVFAVAPPNGAAGPVFGGAFNTFNGSPAGRIVRLDATTGARDAGFTASFNGTVRALLPHGGGYLAGGSFTTYNSGAPVVRSRMARLEGNGALDESFVGPTMPSGLVRAFAVQPNGKIVAGGTFSTAGFKQIARFSSTGALDPTFSTGTGAISSPSDAFVLNNSSVDALAFQTDGKLIAGGIFNQYNGVPRLSLARLGDNLAFTAVSRKIHGGAGPFDISLPLTGNPGVECRSGGATNDYQIVLNLAGVVTYTGAFISSGTGHVSMASGSGTATITLDLTGITSLQTITVTVAAASDGLNTRDLSVPMGVLLGDTNGDRIVNAGDVLQTRGRSGQGTAAGNFRSDVNADGFVNSGDTLSVRSRSGTSLP